MCVCVIIVILTIWKFQQQGKVYRLNIILTKPFTDYTHVSGLGPGDGGKIETRRLQNKQ
jgi:hypothetical protein